MHQRFSLLQETLYLTIAILDRYLSHRCGEIKRKKLQLVGVSCMWIASKYEEMYAPEINDFVYITDNAYTSLEIRSMELDILRTLDFNLGKPLPLHFLRRNSKAAGVDAKQHNFAKFFMEMTLQVRVRKKMGVLCRLGWMHYGLEQPDFWDIKKSHEFGSEQC